MDENIFETQAHLEKRSKVREFYNNNKKIIFSILSILIAFLIYLNFYIESKKNKHVTLSDSYIDAKIYIRGNCGVFSNDSQQQIDAERFTLTISNYTEGKSDPLAIGDTNSHYYDINYDKLDYLSGDPRSIGNYLYKIYCELFLLLLPLSSQTYRLGHLFLRDVDNLKQT